MVGAMSPRRRLKLFLGLKRAQNLPLRQNLPLGHVKSTAFIKVYVSIRLFVREKRCIHEGFLLRCIAYTTDDTITTRPVQYVSIFQQERLASSV